MRETTDHFFDIPMTKYQTSSGELDLPILYYDYGYAHYLFWVDYDRAAPKLEGTIFKPCKFLANKAAVFINFFEYRDTAIGPYNEVGLSILCHPKDQQPPGLFVYEMLKDAKQWRMGAYVINLPVTTEIAYVGGREVWSYPKFVTNISIALHGRQFHGAVDDPQLGQRMFELNGKIGWAGSGLSLSNASFISHTTHQGKALRTLTEVDTKFKANLGFSGRLAVNPQSEHEMAKNLIDMGLPNQKPFFTMYSHKAKMILHPGVPIDNGA